MKACPKCVSVADDHLRFCTHCGTRLSPPPTTEPPATSVAGTPPPAIPSAPKSTPEFVPQPAPQQTITGNVHLFPDGKYRWIYELNMWSNSSILRLLFKVFGGIIAIMWGFFFVICLVNDDLDELWSYSKVILIVAGVLFILILLSYAIVAAINGGKYIVLFEMNERGILHRQMKSQVKKSQAIGWLAILAGAMAGNVTTIGIGINAATNSQIYSGFEAVRTVKPFRKRNLIKVNELLFKNQVYVKDEDFDFVLNYILSRCPKVKF